MDEVEMFANADHGDEVYHVKADGVSDHDTAPYRVLMLRAFGVSKRFGALEALKSIDFEIPRHSIVSLIGPNGSGKTVFFKALTGLQKPDSGTIWFNGQVISQLPPDRITGLGIAQTFQSIRLFSNMTVLENVLVGQHCRLHSNIWGVVLRTAFTSNEERKATNRALELLEYVGLPNTAHLMAKSLSYGAQRRLEIARAVASNPQLLLLDEPTAGMNPQETHEVVDLLGRLRRDLSLTILLVEHDMRVVMGISDRVTVLDNGVKVSEGPPKQVRADPRVVETYLGKGGNLVGAWNEKT